MASFKVALVQTWPKALSAAENFAYAASQIRSGAEQGASLAVLPEYHLTGWAPGQQGFALTPKDAEFYLQEYQKLAKDFHINICTGTIVCETPQCSRLDASCDGQHDDEAAPALLNTSHFIDHDGQILGSYTKTNLWIPERQYLTSYVDYVGQSATVVGGPPTNPHQVFDTPLGRVGILVCWDLAFPEAFRQLVLAGANIIIMPSYWTTADMCEQGRAYNEDCEKMFVETALVTRAFESTAAIIYCNAGGPAEEGFFGCSQVVLPIVGKVPGSFEDGQEGTRVLDVDMHLVDIAEGNYKIRQDLARENWHYGYAKARDVKL